MPRRRPSSSATKRYIKRGNKHYMIMKRGTGTHVRTVIYEKDRSGKYTKFVTRRKSRMINPPFRRPVGAYPKR